jgi:hypothetical protein
VDFAEPMPSWIRPEASRGRPVPDDRFAANRATRRIASPLLLLCAASDYVLSAVRWPPFPCSARNPASSYCTRSASLLGEDLLGRIAHM